MCGIAGFVSLSGDQPDPRRLSRMMATLRHRGPDDRGEYIEGPAALGAARLSIIDVAGGHQPIDLREQFQPRPGDAAPMRRAMNCGVAIGATGVDRSEQGGAPIS